MHSIPIILNKLSIADVMLQTPWPCLTPKRVMEAGRCDNNMMFIEWNCLKTETMLVTSLNYCYNNGEYSFRSRFHCLHSMQEILWN